MYVQRARILEYIPYLGQAVNNAARLVDCVAEVVVGAKGEEEVAVEQAVHRQLDQHTLRQYSLQISIWPCKK